MTTPTLFSDVAGDPNLYKYSPNGVLFQEATVTVPAAFAADANIGMIRFNTGFRPIHIAITSEALDAATDNLLDIGWLYDGTTGEDDNGLVNDSAIAQTGGGSVVWPVASGLLTAIGFVATGPGYLSITNRVQATETEGVIRYACTFTYDPN